MSGIDAPEIDQEGGQESKILLEEYVKKPATLKWEGIDPYNRTLGILFVNGKSVNIEMVRSGNAWHYKKYSSDPELAKAEKYARQNKLGLWKYQNPITPWDFRRKEK